MARTIILELTDEQEQQLLRQAQQLNLPIESVLLRSITQPSSLQDLPNKEYMLRFYLISDLFSTMRAARLAGQTTTEVPLSDIALTFTQFMKRSGQIASFELIHDPEDSHILLHLNPNPQQFTPPPIDPQRLIHNSPPFSKT
jgi:hypothetical protein